MGVDRWDVEMPRHECGRIFNILDLVSAVTDLSVLSSLSCHCRLCAHILVFVCIIIIITRLMTHVKVIHRVKNRKCGGSRISEGKLGCKVQTLPVV